MTEIPIYQNEPTSDPHIFRVVDRDGDWTHYFNDQTNQYLVAVNRVISLGFPKGAGLIEWLKKTTPEEAEKRLQSAGERGSRVHTAIRDLIDGQTVSLDTPYPTEDGGVARLTNSEWDCLLSFQRWATAFKPEVSSHEDALWHKNHLYAGTRDFKGQITIEKGTKLSVDDKYITWPETRTVRVNPLDWKTGGSYDDHKLQVAAYNACDPTAYDYTGIVRFGTTHKSGYEMKLWSRAKTREHYQIFLNAKTNYHFLQGKDWAPSTKTIPLSLAVAVPQASKKIKKKKAKLEKAKKEAKIGDIK